MLATLPPCKSHIFLGNGCLAHPLHMWFMSERHEADKTMLQTSKMQIKFSHNNTLLLFFTARHWGQIKLPGRSNLLRYSTACIGNIKLMTVPGKTFLRKREISLRDHYYNL